MPSERFATCLFCDDIRQEVGSKVSFMGVYGPDMIFAPDPSEGPLVVPRFAIVAWLTFDIDDKPKDVSLSVFMPPGKTEVIKTELPVAQLEQHSVIQEGASKYRFQATFPIVNLIIPCSGFMDVVFVADGKEIRAGRLRIVIPNRPDSAPNASQPPSEQSQPFVPVAEPSPVRRRPSSRRTERNPERE
jgi:hypothetical protein